MSTDDSTPARRQPRHEVKFAYEIQAPALGEETVLERAQTKVIHEVLDYLHREQPETEPGESRRSQHG